jgi:hypothetical protein
MRALVAWPQPRYPIATIAGVGSVALIKFLGLGVGHPCELLDLAPEFLSENEPFDGASTVKIASAQLI